MKMRSAHIALQSPHFILLMSIILQSACAFLMIDCMYGITIPVVYKPYYESLVQTFVSADIHKHTVETASDLFNSWKQHLICLTRENSI